MKLLRKARGFGKFQSGSERGQVAEAMNAMLSAPTREPGVRDDADGTRHAVSRSAFEPLSSHRPESGNGMLVEMRGAQQARRLLAIDTQNVKEGFFGILGGVAYGMAGPVMGHPLDTVKTKMQGEAKFRSMTATQVARSMIKTEGLGSFYRGIVPNLAGSAVFGGIVMGTYKGCRIACKGTWLDKSVPGSGGMSGSVLVGGLVSAAARSSIETPLALMKVRQQVGASWKLNSANERFHLLNYWRGAGPTFFRCWAMLGTFFVMVDQSERRFPDLVNTPIIGPFVKGAVCASIGWVVAWPMEVVKTRVQADIKGEIKGNTLVVLRQIIRTEGPKAMCRGLNLGLTKSFLANGMAMLALEMTNKLRLKCC